ncbi:hypothetical protein ACFL6G_09480, partial [candidate division KSB1 bacterium]
MSNKPPKLLIRLLRVFSDRSFHTHVLGDLEEIYRDVYYASGKIRASWWLFRQIVKSSPVFFINLLLRNMFML